MSFFKKFFSWDYYHQVLAGKIKFSFFKIVLILSLVSILRPSNLIVRSIYPYLPHLQKSVLDAVDQVFPADLVIKIKNGIVLTNVTEPYYITVRKDFLDNIFSAVGAEKLPLSKYRLVAIDTKGKAENFENYQSLSLLTESSFIYYNNDNINISSLRDIRDFTLSREIIRDKIKEINKNNIIATMLTVVLFLSPLLIFLSAFFAFLFMILFMSAGIYIIGKILQLSYPFGNIFRYTAAVGFIPSLIQNGLEQFPAIGDKLIPVTIFTDLFIITLCYLGMTKMKNIEKKSK